MNVSSEPLEATAIQTAPSFSVLFNAHYPRIARIIVRIISDPGRAEELAADVFWKYLSNARMQAEDDPGGWLYRVAVRKGLDELRRRGRRERYERYLPFLRHAASPEESHDTACRQQQVRSVLASLKTRDAELLILRGEGFRYPEIAGILAVNETSIGTLLRRAQDAFRKEYVKRYGKPLFS